jgi:hypothetical protein
MPISPSAQEVLMGAMIDIADEAFDHRIERIPAVRASSWRGSNFERTVRLQAVFFEEQFARLKAHAQSLMTPPWTAATSTFLDMAWESLRRRFELECSFQVADARAAVLFLLSDEFVSKNPTINRCMTDRFGACACRLPWGWRLKRSFAEPQGFST